MMVATAVIDPETITRAVLPVYLMILAGLVARRARLLGKDVDGPLMGVTVNVLMPCLILDNLLGNPALRGTGDVLLAVAAGVAGVIASMAVCLGWGRAAGLHKGTGLRTFALTAGLQNYGFIAIPVMAAVFPGQGPMGVLFVHNLGVEFAMWSAGLMLLSGTWRGIGRALVNGPILAVLLGLFLARTGWDAAIPPALRAVFHGFGAGAIPLSLLLVGLTMSDLMFSERPTLRIALNAVVVRLVVCAALLLALARFLPCARELKMVLVVQAAMPAAVFPIVLARHYGGSPAVAIQIVLATGLAGLFTAPVVVAWGVRWVLGGY